MSNVRVEILGDPSLKHISPFFLNKNRNERHIAIFLSGSGTNAEKILEYWQKNATETSCHFILFTDRPEGSNARIIAKKYNLELLENDIKLFYKQRKCNRVTLTTSIGRQIREEWTEAVRQQLKPYPIDFVLFAGFIPLTNITADFPCLNVHPGDLTYLKNGRRYLIGLHTIPIEKAILEGLQYLRSSVILAQPYNNDEGAMDNGPILGISEKIGIDLFGYALNSLQKIADTRPKDRPITGYQDELERIAKCNQEKLKRRGDWIIFPQVAYEFSKGNYSLDGNGNLYYRDHNNWIRVETLMFGKNKRQIIPPKNNKIN